MEPSHAVMEKARRVADLRVQLAQAETELQIAMHADTLERQAAPARCLCRRWWSPSQRRAT